MVPLNFPPQFVFQSCEEALLILRISVSRYRPRAEWILPQTKSVCFQAYATVVSAAEANNPDSTDFGKVEEVKQYPSVPSYIPSIHFML